MKKNKAKFKFYELVKVINEDPKYSEIYGKVGCILGMAEGEEEWGYAISFYDEMEGWDVMESDLESTGKFGKRSDFYPE